MNVKEEIKYLNEREKMWKTKRDKADEFSCKICVYIRSKKKLKMHNKSDHNPKITCESCEEAFEKNCDLEHVSVERSHDLVKKFECDKCGKKKLLYGD